MGHGQYDGIGLDAGVIGVHPPPVAGRCSAFECGAVECGDRANARTQPDVGVVVSKHRSCGVAVQLTERNTRYADVAGVGFAEQAVLKDHRAERQRHLS